MDVWNRLSRTAVSGLVLGVLAGAAASCDSPTDPGTPNPAPGTPFGSVDVTTHTAGSAIDPDGYSIRLDGQPGPAIGTVDTASLTQLAAGNHSIELQGLAPNCSVATTNPQVVAVNAGGTSSINFPVNCAGAAGSIAVTTTTTSLGSVLDLDPDGYQVWLDGVWRGNASVDGTITLGHIDVGDYEVELRHVESNCSVTGTNPLMITVLEDATAQTNFEIECAFVQREIVFVRDGAIMFMAADGSSERMAALEPAHRDFAWPSWSPDGSKIVFSRFWCWYDCTIKVLDLDTGEIDDLTGPGGLHDQPEWSPDGSRIAYTRGEVGQIHVMNADGSGDVQLTNSTEGNGVPAWSPDGSKIVFTSFRDGNSELYVMNANGSNQTRLTFDPEFDGAPDWSPDGSRIAFVSRRDGTNEIYLMDPDGSNLEQLTFSQWSGSPAWSADGSKIVFTHQSSVWTMNADGSGRQALTNSPSTFEGWPDWLP